MPTADRSEDQSTSIQGGDAIAYAVPKKGLGNTRVGAQLLPKHLPEAGYKQEESRDPQLTERDKALSEL
jgi:hypothetical protein